MLTYTNTEQLKEYIKTRLGEPAIDLEIEFERKNGFGQVDIAIQDSLKWFIRENADEGSFKDIMILYPQAGITVYDVPDDITEIVQAQPVYGNGFTPFTSFDVGSRESLVATTGWAQFDLVTYVAAQQYLGDVNKYIGKKYDIHFYPSQHKMRIYPTPKSGQDRALLFTVYRRADLIDIYNNILFQELVVATATVQWGINVTKDRATLPGGGAIDGAGIMSRGNDMRAKALQDIKDESRKAIITVG
jgi:hypothetical protein